MCALFCTFAEQNASACMNTHPLIFKTTIMNMTLVYIALGLAILCIIGIIIAIIQVHSLKKGLPELHRQEFDRLESKVTEENRNARIELTSRIDKIRTELADNVVTLRGELSNNIIGLRKESNDSAKTQRDELKQSLQTFQEAFDKNVEKLQSSQRNGFTEMVNAQKERFNELDKRQATLVETTEKKLEEMRVTVDEKLQKTLNERLGESFKLVGEQLESVQKGLGEMKSLASEVGGLKNALTNVKVRGNFGELQLKALLEQMLSPEQYDENVATARNSTERVEFAIKLPGKDNHTACVYLPIDSKFPKDVYDQYIEALDNGDATTIKAKSKQFESTIQKMAKDIQTKYIDVPNTTDFAIMFAPVENIYAEVIRRPKLMQELRDQYHILVTGPTTLGALLSSLQMGFRTLAIQKRSSEVWEMLSAVKTQFGKFGELLEKAKNNLNIASNTLEELQGKRTRAIIRSLKGVEKLPEEQANQLLPDLGEEEL